MDYMTELSAIAKAHGGIIETKIAAQIGISKAMLCKLCKENKIHRIVKGQYIFPDDMQDELLAISNRSDRIIFSHETAFYLHGISDRTPFKHMANEILKGSVPAIPSAGAPITQVNQYGDRSVHADHVENLNVTVIENQGSPTEDENGVPFVPLTPTRYDSTTRIIYLGTEEVKLPVQLTPQSSISPQELPYVNAL